VPQIQSKVTLPAAHAVSVAAMTEVSWIGGFPVRIGAVVSHPGFMDPPEAWAAFRNRVEAWSSDEPLKAAWLETCDRYLTGSAGDA